MLDDSTGILNVANTANGTIYRAVLDIQGSAAAAPATFSNQVQSAVFQRSNLSTQTSNLSTVVLQGGRTFYLVVAGSALYVYTSLEAAVAGFGPGQLFFKTATTAKGTYLADVAIVRYGLAELGVVS